MSYLTNRVQQINRLPILPASQYVIYFMHSSIRVGYNYALQRAMELSEELQKPLKVVYYLHDTYTEYSYRQYHFVLTGLKQVIEQLQSKSIGVEIVGGDFRRAMKPLQKQAAVWVLDRGYLRFEQHLHHWFAEYAKSAVYEVEDNVMVPIESVSHKSEWMARTIRPRILKKLNYFSRDFQEGISYEEFQKLAPLKDFDALWSDKQFLAEPVELIDAFLKKIQKERPLSLTAYVPGEQGAIERLDTFVQEKLSAYDENRNHPELKATSHLSPYLHFGMISPLLIYRTVKGQKGDEPFIEQFVIRRELSQNFVFFTPHYDRFVSLPLWARRTLRDHQSDPRPYHYTLEDLEAAQTHDPYWNAAMREMVQTGYMENVMRMYWGKKIIEWSDTPEQAYELILYLNNHYFLDGTDANSFVGVGWCFGLHDRPWMNRPVFGLIRYMNESGLKRKFKIDLYVEQFPE